MVGFSSISDPSCWQNLPDVINNQHVPGMERTQSVQLPNFGLGLKDGHTPMAVLPNLPMHAPVQPSMHAFLDGCPVSLGSVDGNLTCMATLSSKSSAYMS